MSKPRTLVETTPLNIIRLSSWQGVQAISSYAQLSALLSDHLSPEHAALFAEPVMDQMGEKIDWYSHTATIPQRLNTYDTEQQAVIRQKIISLAADVQNLAESLYSQSDSNSRMAGKLLELALTYPSEEYIFVADQQPILICWGCTASNVAAAPEPLTRLAAVAPPPTVSPTASAPTAPLSQAIDHRGRFPWWIILFLLGVLLCLLLLPWLLPRLGLPMFTLDFLPAGCQYTAPTTDPSQAQTSPPPATTEIPVPQITLPDGMGFAMDKERALREELGRLQKMYQQQMALCVPPTPPVIDKAEIDPPIPEPEPVPEPEPRSDMQLADIPAPIEKPDAPPPPKQEQASVMDIPDDADKTGKMDFLEGCWIADLKEKLVNTDTNLPLTFKFCFNQNGRGETLIQEFDARGRKKSECRGSATATVTGKSRLKIDDNASIVCPNGSTYQRHVIQCSKKGSGTLCTRINQPRNWGEVYFRRTRR